MKTVNCYWELENLGLPTVEVSYDLNEPFDKEELLRQIDGYKYAVAKVTCGNVDCLLGLQEQGFQLIETQLNFTKKYDDFDFEDKIVKLATRNIEFRPVKTEEDLNVVLENMTLGMFTTDRVYLDPKLGPALGLRRYQNWMRTEFHKGTTFFTFWHGNDIVGFEMIDDRQECINGLLGGVYEKYQRGYGMLTACAVPMYAKVNNKPFKLWRGPVSSNNMPVIQLFNHLNFKLEKMTYVLVKHID
jgi:hypothetical protein